jgi:hypothetical protein
VDLSTHQIVNTFNFVPQGQYGGGIWTSPSLDTATNTIFVTTGTRNQPSQTLSEAVVALDATTLALKSTWAVPASQETVDSDFGSTPILFNDAAGNPLMAAVNKNGLAYVYNRNNLSAGLYGHSRSILAAVARSAGTGAPRLELLATAHCSWAGDIRSSMDKDTRDQSTRWTQRPANSDGSMVFLAQSFLHWHIRMAWSSTERVPCSRYSTHRVERASTAIQQVARSMQRQV